MSWVGCTEYFDASLQSLKAHFGLDGLRLDSIPVNRSTVTSSMRAEVLSDHVDFISSHNELDIKLYTYFKEYIWTKYREVKGSDGPDRQHSLMRGRCNAIAYQLRRQILFSPSPLQRRSFEVFYDRWFRK